MTDLNLNNAIPAAIIGEFAENAPRLVSYMGLKIPLHSFSYIEQILDKAKNFVWLIKGQVNDVTDLHKTKKFLVANGVLEKNIVNFGYYVTTEWVANIRYIEKNPIDYFATGISYVEAGLNFHVIPEKGGRRHKSCRFKPRFTSRLSYS